MIRTLQSAATLFLALSMTACVTNETRPVPKLVAVQATTQIPQEELLDVGIRIFDAGIPASIANDDEALAKKRIYPDLRRAEARYMPTLLRETLEGSAQWGAVRVVPETAQFIDVIVAGKLVDSNGGLLTLEVSAWDAAGRTWIKDKRYTALADLGSYKTEAALQARDPFQNIYSEIANDLVAARDKLTALDRVNIRKIASLKFAADLAPEAMQGMVTKDKQGVAQIARLPADTDPTLGRIERIRERDTAVVDTRASPTPWRAPTGAGARRASPSSRRKCARNPRPARARCSARRRSSPASSRLTSAAVTTTTAGASKTPRATRAPWAASPPCSRA
jgi:hypothetical protein